MKKTCLLLATLVLALLALFQSVEVAYATETYGAVLIDTEGPPVMPMNYPQAIYNDTAKCTFFVYQGYEEVTRKFYANTYNHTSGELSEPFYLGTSYEDDGHFAPSIGVLWNGSLIVLYDSHSYTPGYIKYRVSINAYDTTSWYSYKTKTGDYTYPQLVTFGNEMRVFIRVSTGSYDSDWFRYTFNSVGFWLDETLIIDDSDPVVDEGRMYALFTKDTDGYIYMSGSHGNVTVYPGWRGNLHFAYSKDRGVTWLKANDTSLSLPLGFAETLISEEDSMVTSTFPFVGSDNKARIMAIRGKNTVDYWTGLRYCIWNGESWDIDWVKDENNQMINMSGSNALEPLIGVPTGYSCAPFRDASFNSTAFWFTHNDTRKLTRYVVGDYEADFIFARTVELDIVARWCLGMAVSDHANPYECYADTGRPVDGSFTYDLYYTFNEATYLYTLKGKYSEDTGEIYPPSTRAVNITAYFTDHNPETFELNATYYYGSAYQPLYFSFNTTKNRQYWLGKDENEATIYVYDTDLTTYTIGFYDLAGLLDDYPFVDASRYITGNLTVVEKRKVDVEKKVVMALKNGERYTIKVHDGSTYTFGDLTVTATTTIQLTLKGLDFPKETLLTYKNVRIYGTRVWDPSGTGSISITYEDLLNKTTSVKIDINYRNGTNAYTTTKTDDSFVQAWLSAKNDTDYAVVCTITHEKYGVWEWKQYFPKSLSTAPWGLDFLGSLPFATSIILPGILICFVAGAFSQINAEVGAFMAVVTAIILTYMGWINISAGYLITALSLTILMALIYSKRRVQTY